MSTLLSLLLITLAPTTPNPNYKPSTPPTTEDKKRVTFTRQDAKRFPDHKIAWGESARHCTLHRDALFAAQRNPKNEQLQQAFHKAEHDCECWRALEMIQDVGNPAEGQAGDLKYLWELLGDKDYLAGRMP